MIKVKKVKNCSEFYGIVGNLRNAVVLPEGESENEWIAFNIWNFNKQINMLYGTVLPSCTMAKCPIMNAGQRYVYNWSDGKSKPKSLPGLRSIFTYPKLTYPKPTCIHESHVSKILPHINENFLGQNNFTYTNFREEVGEFWINGRFFLPMVVFCWRSGNG